MSLVGKKPKTRGKYVLISSLKDHSHGWISGDGGKYYSLDYSSIDGFISVFLLKTKTPKYQIIEGRNQDRVL